MESASLAASGSGQQRVKRLATDAEPEAQIGVPPIALAANTRRRIAVKSAPLAVTTQEGINGYRGKTMRIASVEQVELANIMELSTMGQMEHEESQSLDSCQTPSSKDSLQHVGCDNQGR